MEKLTVIPSDGHEPAMACKSHGDRLRALFEPLLAHQHILGQIIELNMGDWLGAALLDLRDPKSVRDRAISRYRLLPKRDTLHAWDDELCQALEGKADQMTLSLMLTTMFDIFPRGTISNVGSYVEALSLVMGDRALSQEILAAAIVRVWRKIRFPPSISEFLDECEGAKKAATGTRATIKKMLALLDNAEDALVATGDLSEAASSRTQKGANFD
jgi:hypothetical protein